jgi:trans-aconitate 2-methyltransferase
MNRRTPKGKPFPAILTTPNLLEAASREAAVATWDPSLYLKFGGERTQPALDLVNRVALADPRRIVDLGCGPGNSTELLRRRWPAADVLGLDNSPEMIAAASRSYPEGRWELGDAGTWTATQPFDLVFANATLHWVPDHARAFPHLFSQVAAGGALAVQMPVHRTSAVHQCLFDLARRPEWEPRLRQALHAMTSERPAFYYDLLRPLADRLDLWETEYVHALDGPEAIVEWVRGTGLRPFLAALTDAADRARFQGLLLEGVTAAYPRQRDGRVLFPFRRIFLVAYH